MIYEELRRFPEIVDIYNEAKTYVQERWRKHDIVETNCIPFTRESFTYEYAGINFYDWMKKGYDEGWDELYHRIPEPILAYYTSETFPMNEQVVSGLLKILYREYSCEDPYEDKIICMLVKFVTKYAINSPEKGDNKYVEYLVERAFALHTVHYPADVPDSCLVRGTLLYISHNYADFMRDWYRRWQKKDASNSYMKCWEMLDDFFKAYPRFKKYFMDNVPWPEDYLAQEWPQE